MLLGGQALVWAAVIAALMLMVKLSEFEHGTAICLQCGGKGAHRDDCPLKED